MTAPIDPRLDGNRMRAVKTSQDGDGSRMLRILVVDDHADTAHVMGRLLELDGHAVKWVTSVAEAMAAAETQPFDLLLSDIMLPDESGLDLMQRLKERGAIKGIAMSGNTQSED